jgi:hypothetical protein
MKLVDGVYAAWFGWIDAYGKCYEMTVMPFSCLCAAQREVVKCRRIVMPSEDMLQV